MNLFHHSIDIILKNQSPSGAFIASPNFETYAYSWFRDGAFVAYAMDRVGEHDSAGRFQGWVSAAVNKRAAVVKRALDKAHSGEALDQSDFLDTRYALDGKSGEEEWPNFQLDGFGTWLWGLTEHHRLSKRSLPEEWLNAADLVADYLVALWPRPCFDCWEEFPDRIHPHTLAAIYAGLQAHAELTSADHEDCLAEIKAFIQDRGQMNGHYVKYIGSDLVDASLLGLAVPYGVVDPQDPRMMATVSRIEETIVRQGGLHRYAADTYYGGGAWVLLTAWLGWYYVCTGRRGDAEAALAWVEAQSDVAGNLPEQVPTGLNDPAYYQPWRKRWGDIACPLLWSHAKYLILYCALQDKD